MRRLPISLVLYASSKGHWGRQTDYRLTLDHWDRQVPLVHFGGLFAHVKTTPGQEDTAEAIKADLRGRGFAVIESVAGWSRGLSMQEGYMKDVIRMSQQRALYRQPYYLHLEDDSPVISDGCSLEDLLLQSCQLLERDHEVVTVRVARPGDARGPTVDRPGGDPRLYWSQDVNLQPLIMRALDFHRLGIALERNPEACQKVQCELLWRLILDQFSRSPFRHAVWELPVARTIHLGIPQDQHEAACRALNLPCHAPERAA